MRLLHTTSFRLKEYFDENVPDYAILSHTWGRNEVSYHDIQSQSDPNTIDGFDKIKGACALAAREKYDFIWIDTCCIDKSSSSELSEAINSMYSWYQRAAVCYAYLADVQFLAGAEDDITVQEPPRDSPTTSSRSEPNKNSSPKPPIWNFEEFEFRNSRWFTRGWTLQELVAPRKLFFYSRDWKRLGSKDSLRDLISSITGIDYSVLAGGDLKPISVARKMYWASNRTTTRKEDMAYCLMGIFSVNMPLLYGEGERAFLRLQEQIITMNDDQSIFAWTLPRRRAERQLLHGLLAPSPRAFMDTGRKVWLFPPIHRRKRAVRVVNSSLEVEVILRPHDNMPLGRARLPDGCFK
ncbi:unnamed protein product [Clonostachys solani]|uniref:HET-domain-containing protein n=1 Tax=Clonostachys solani TaxID=160281 RepID=A0A9N9Z759_9HYPO|nr:unnamed protein product [Clonostachys solani]